MQLHCVNSVYIRLRVVPYILSSTNCWMCLTFTLCISVKPRIFVKCSRLWSFVRLYFVLVLVLGPPVLVLVLVLDDSTFYKTGVRVSQVKPSNCFRRLENLVLPSMFNTSYSSSMMWNLLSYQATVLNERMRHFRMGAGQNILWPLLHIFRLESGPPNPPWSIRPCQSYLQVIVPNRSRPLRGGGGLR